MGVERGVCDGFVLLLLLLQRLGALGQHALPTCTALLWAGSGVLAADIPPAACPLPRRSSGKWREPG